MAELEQALDRRLQQCTEQQQEVGKQTLPDRPTGYGELTCLTKKENEVAECLTSGLAVLVFHHDALLAFTPAVFRTECLAEIE